MSQPRPTCEVHLDTEGLPLDLTSPVRTADVTYYDAGIWMDRKDDRIFVPYRRVQAIRELPPGETTGEDEGEEESAER